MAKWEVVNPEFWNTEVSKQYKCDKTVKLPHFHWNHQKVSQIYSVEDWVLFFPLKNKNIHLEFLVFFFFPSKIYIYIFSVDIIMLLSEFLVFGFFMNYT